MAYSLPQPEAPQRNSQCLAQKRPSNVGGTVTSQGFKELRLMAAHKGNMWLILQIHLRSEPNTSETENSPTSFIHSIKYSFKHSIWYVLSTFSAKVSSSYNFLLYLNDLPSPITGLNVISCSDLSEAGEQLGTSICLITLHPLATIKTCQDALCWGLSNLKWGHSVFKLESLDIWILAPPFSCLREMPGCWLSGSGIGSPSFCRAGVWFGGLIS